MEKLLVFALLLYIEIAPKDEYWEELDRLFLENPQNDDFLYLEWEPNIYNAIGYMRTHIDCTIFDYELFGRFLIGKLRGYYEQCGDMKNFSDKMYRLWASLPGDIQDKQPFQVLCYAGDPLSYGDFKQTEDFYESILKHYKD